MTSTYKMRLPVFFCFLIAAFAIVFASLPATALASETQYIFDEKDLLTEAQEKAFNDEAAKIEARSGAKICWAFVDKMNGLDNPTSSQRNEFGKSYYKEHISMEGDVPGVLFVCAIDSRDYVTIAYQQDKIEGSVDVELLENEVKPYLAKDDWVGGVEKYYQMMEAFTGRESADNTAGETLFPLIIFGCGALIFAIIAIVITVVVVISNKNKSQTNGFYTPPSNMPLNGNTYDDPYNFHRP